MSGALAQAAEKAREGTEVLEGLDLCRENTENLDLSDLTFRGVSFHACRFIACRLDGAAFYD